MTTAAQYNIFFLCEYRIKKTMISRAIGQLFCTVYKPFKFLKYETELSQLIYSSDFSWHLFCDLYLDPYAKLVTTAEQYKITYAHIFRVWTKIIVQKFDKEKVYLFVVCENSQEANICQPEKTKFWALKNSIKLVMYRFWHKYLWLSGVFFYIGINVYEHTYLFWLQTMG